MKIEELMTEHIKEVVERINSFNMLPFIGKRKVLNMFLEFSNTITEMCRRSIHEDNERLLCRLAELDKLYEERERERQEALVKLMCEMKNEMMKASRVAFCNGVCKYSSSGHNTALCYCARRQRFLKSLEEDVNKYIQYKKEKLTTKYNEVSWKKEK